ncbi:MAG: DUF2235 domain-containing protein [Proteobacteria bacterium]|nr:DUF2235 domain-containing protein [Pseudomonadota bacterium]
MKRIVLLSDGTGNSSAKLFKTNVWRLYQSLDLTRDGDSIPQIACYNDGVGTSAFRPLALLGGAFGYGLKRNVLHLYEFLCEHWEPGDEIYIFGFSRGAFTARIVAGLIAREGVLRDVDAKTLSYATRDIYRHYRLARGIVVAMPIIVRLARPVRDAAIAVWRRMWKQIQYDPDRQTPVEQVTFVGVWDTVAAYGTPLAELTRGIDLWVFPLSMPDRKLNRKVATARHALALDDERDTFHPVIWDEIESHEPERIKQVWFAGMHADVGGGYPDDALSHQPLAWMMQEAAAVGLRFLPNASDRFAPPPSASAPIHDSRKGMSGYYRYQPRRLSAFLLPDDPETVAMRNPSRKAKAHLKSVILHHSVMQRLTTSVERYAPVVLPGSFQVLQPDGSVAAMQESPEQRRVRMDGQAQVWDEIWRKRINYFLTVFVSAVLATMPFWGSGPEAGACTAWYCSISPLIRGLGGFLPFGLSFWTDAFATHPGATLLLVAALTLLLLRGASQQQRIHDLMWAVLAPFRGGRAPRTDGAGGLVRRIRTNHAYLSTIRWLKWQALPNLFGVGVLLFGLLGGLLIVAVPVARQAIATAESNDRFCKLDPPRDDAKQFATAMLCWKGQEAVKAGNTYSVRLMIQEDWLDSTIATGPEGFESSRFKWLVGYLALPVRRSLSGRWFQPFVTIESSDGIRHVQPLEFYPEGSRFVATLVPRADGTVRIWVNDVVLWWNGFTNEFYQNNRGSADIVITLIKEKKDSTQ